PCLPEKGRHGARRRLRRPEGSRAIASGPVIRFAPVGLYLLVRLRLVYSDVFASFHLVPFNARAVQLGANSGANYWRRQLIRPSLRLAKKAQSRSSSAGHHGATKHRCDDRKIGNDRDASLGRESTGREK